MCCPDRAPRYRECLCSTCLLQWVFTGCCFLSAFFASKVQARREPGRAPPLVCLGRAPRVGTRDRGHRPDTCRRGPHKAQTQACATHRRAPHTCAVDWRAAHSASQAHIAGAHPATLLVRLAHPAALLVRLVSPEGKGAREDGREGGGSEVGARSRSKVVLASPAHAPASGRRRAAAGRRTLREGKREQTWARTAPRTLRQPDRESSSNAVILGPLSMPMRPSSVKLVTSTRRRQRRASSRCPSTCIVPISDEPEHPSKGGGLPPKGRCVWEAG